MATSIAAAKMLAEGLRSVDPHETNDIILCLNEIRGPRAASNLVARIGRADLRVTIVSGYRRRDRFDQQQDVIATTLPVAEAHWSKWKNAREQTPPRGYAFAAVVINPTTTANVYAVHLKSNYGARTAEAWADNRAKRTAAVAQLVKQEQPKRGRSTRPVIVAGDMNADRWGKGFPEEELFSRLEQAGFDNPLELLPADRRGTHPSARFGDSALDYVFCRGLSAKAPPTITPNEGLSDHRALFVLLGD